MLPIYRDKSQEIIIQKAVQMGISEWAICETFSLCEQGLAVFYVHPTQIMRSSFVKNRIDPLKNKSKYYSARLKEIGEGADSSVMKHFGKGVVKFVGSNAIAEFGEFPADCAIIDERDRCNWENLPYAKDRLQASKFKLYREVGNPTVEGKHINESFKNSDQKYWQIKCPHCNEWQCLDFFINIVRQKSDSSYELLDLDWREDSNRDISVYCRKCGRIVDRLSEGEFVAKIPGRKVSGYQLSNLFYPTVSIRELWELFNEGLGDETKKQVFYNSRLGLAFTSTGAKLSLALLEACQGDYANLTTGKNCVMGIDVGAKLHVIIKEKLSSGIWRTIHIGSYREFSQLDEVMSQFDVKVGVIDAMPETRKALEFQRKHGQRVWLCRYFAQPNLQAIKRNEQERTLEVDRTQTLDSSHAEILSKKTLFPKNFKTIDGGDFVSQMCAPTRIWDEQSQRFKWMESGPDHYRHADNYAWMAEQLIGNSMMIGILESAGSED